MNILSGQDFTAASDLRALVALVSKTGRSVVCTPHSRSMGRGLRTIHSSASTRSGATNTRWGSCLYLT